MAAGLEFRVWRIGVDARKSGVCPEGLHPGVALLLLREHQVDHRHEELHAPV